MTTLSSPRPAAGPGRRAGWTMARIAGALFGCARWAIGRGRCSTAGQRDAAADGGINLGTWSSRASYAVASSTTDMHG